MRLTKRENILIIILMFVMAGYLVFKYIVTPQFTELNSLKSSVTEWEEKKQSLAVIDETMKQLTEQKKQVETQIQTIGNGYFPSLDTQEESIIALNDLLLNSGLKDLSINFDRVKNELPADVPTGSTPPSPLVQKVSLTYEGSYDAIWNELRAIWNFKKFIRVDSINIHQTSQNAGILSGNLELSLYDLSQMSGIRDGMVEWAESGTFRKANPFQPPYNEVFPGTRYVLDITNQATNKYVKFVDIAGNWAEAAIDDFGSRHLIAGDQANRYFPDEPITRGDLVVLLDKVFQWEVPDNSVDLTQFSDYSELGQSLSSMEKAFYKGYLKGYFIGFDDGSLRPNSPTSYNEFELVMGRILNKPEFRWKDAALSIQQETGHMSPGISDPGAIITRAEAVYFLHTLSL